MERAFDVLSSDDLDADTATLAAELGRLHHFAGDRATALARIETALEVAEALRIPGLLAGTLNTKSLILLRRPHESHALLSEALRIALDNDLAGEALRAYNNLIVFLGQADRNEQVRAMAEDALQLARRRGDRFWEMRLTTALAWTCRERGDWDQSLALTETLPRDSLDVSVLASRCGAAAIELERGRPDQAKSWLEGIPEPGDEATADQQVLSVARWAVQLRAELDGRPTEALATIEPELVRSIDTGQTYGLDILLQSAATLAAAIGDPGLAEQIVSSVETMSPSAHTRAIDSQFHRIRANAAAARGDGAGAAEAFGLALAAARNLGFPPLLGPVLYDYARWLLEDGRADDAAPLLAEARELFAKMGATVWLQRLDEVEPAATVA
jgi:tetratricopeptide (TPR) repeat protein